MISIINSYLSSKPPSIVIAAVEAMVAKVSLSGHPGILSYEMFRPDAGEEVVGLFRYADAAAWIGHHELIKDWQEFVDLRDSLSLTSIRFFGTIPSEIHAWLAQANFDTSIIEECPPLSRYVK